MKRYGHSGTPTLLKAIGYTIVTLLIIAALFAIVVLVYGGCTNQSFIDVLKDWFTKKATTPTESTNPEAIETFKLFIH